LSVNPQQRIELSLRLEAGLLVCTFPRRTNRTLPCESIICRPRGATLVVRCKNCKNDHVFGIRNGTITVLDHDDPEALRALAPAVLPPLPARVR
jgi:hypothetical protein